MTTAGTPTASAANGNGSSGRRLGIIIAAAVVILLIVGGILAATMGSTKPSASGSSTASVSPSPSASFGVGITKPAASGNSNQSASPSPSASTSPIASASISPAPKVDPAYGVPVAHTVPKDAPGDFGDGVTSRIAAITSITAAGTQAGEVSGPAAQVDIELRNGTSAAISLVAVTVNAYYGTDKTPASPIASSSGRGGFSGTLEAGKTARARFVFSASTGQQKSLVVTISKDAGAPVIVFQ